MMCADEQSLASDTDTEESDDDGQQDQPQETAQ